MLRRYPVGVVMAVAEQTLGDGDSLEVKPDVVFVGHAGAAVKLNGLVRHLQTGAAGFCLGHRAQARRLRRSVLQRFGGFEHQGFQRRQRRVQHGGSVLQGLEAADQAAELLAALQVFTGQIKGRARRSELFRGVQQRA